jgi:hypothetical protein
MYKVSTGDCNVPISYPNCKLTNWNVKRSIQNYSDALSVLSLVPLVVNLNPLLTPQFFVDYRLDLRSDQIILLSFVWSDVHYH